MVTVYIYKYKIKNNIFILYLIYFIHSFVFYIVKIDFYNFML
jgi:hypothetical protein